MRSYKKHRPRMVFHQPNGVDLFVYGVAIRPQSKKLKTYILWRWENDHHRKMRESLVRYDNTGQPFMFVGSERRNVWLNNVRGI